MNTPTTSFRAVRHFLRKAKLTLFCCLLAALASGCAFSRTETGLAFRPNISNSLGKSASTLEVGEIKDSRAVKDGYVLLHKQNDYGTTSGAYVTKTPVAEILKDGLVQTLRENGFISANAAKYQLRGDIQKFEMGGVSGFWTATIIPQLTMRFELIDKVSGDAVWHDTYIGKTTGETAWGTKEFLSQMFSGAAEDVVKQLIADKNFRKFFQNRENLTKAKL